MTRSIHTPGPVHAFARRRLLLAAGTALLPLGAAVRAAPATPIEVWKSPTCGCCKDWMAHLESSGFRVTARDEGNVDARARLGIPMQYGSCHTARVGGYAIEGHVPASEIRRLLKEKPAAIGLAVPAMPIGSPGMDGPDYGGRKDPYDVLLVHKNGSTSIYRSYRGA